MEKRVISTQIMEEDIKNEKNLRPQTLENYIGQKKAKENQIDFFKFIKITYG